MEVPVENGAEATQSDQPCQHGRRDRKKTTCAGVCRRLKKFRRITPAMNLKFRRAGAFDVEFFAYRCVLIPRCCKGV